MKLEYIIKENDKYITVKDVLLSCFNISHRLLVTLKKQNCIYLNNEITYIYKNVKAKDVVTINLDYEEDNSNIIPVKQDLNILYEDDSLLIINKPSRNTCTSFYITL